MAERYWVGGTASWDGTAGTKWALTDNGAGGQAVPTAADNVYFTALSGAVTVTVATATALCANLTFTGFTGTFAGAQAMTVSGNAVFASTGSWTYTGLITFNSTTSQTITTNTRALDSAITFDGVAGSWVLQDALVNGATRTTTLTNGTFNLNNFNFSTGLFVSSNSNARTLTSGTGQINLTYAGGGAATVWNTNTNTLMTITDRPTINLTGNNTAGSRTITGTSVSEALSPSVNITAGSDAVVIGYNTLNTVFSGTFTGSWSNSGRTCYGNLTLKTGMTVTAGANTFIMGATSGTKTITTAGLTIDFPFRLNGVGGTWQLQDPFVQGSTRLFSLFNGTFDANGFSMTIGTFLANAGTKTLTLGAVTVTVLGSGASAWDAATGATGLTVTASTGKISMSSASAKSFLGGAKTWPILEQSGAGTLTVTGANTFADIQWSASGTIALPASTVTTVTAFTGPTGTGSGTLTSSSAGTAAALSKVSGSVAVANLSIQDSAASGGATFIADPARGNTNVSGNSGWVFSPYAPVSAPSLMWEFVLGLPAGHQSRVNILCEGDSYMTTNGNGTLLLTQLQIATQFLRPILSTAVSGSTIDGILTRLTAEPALISGSTTVIWDGDPSGYGSAAAYLAKIDSILLLTGTTSVLFVRPCTFGPSASSTPTAATLDMETIYAGLLSRGVTSIDPVPVINALSSGSVQDLQDIQARCICTSALQVDGIHLVAAAKTLMGTTIASRLASAGI